MIIFLLIVIALILAFAFFPAKTGQILYIAFTLAFFGVLAMFIGWWSLALLVFGLACTFYQHRNQESV